MQNCWLGNFNLDEIVIAGTKIDECFPFDNFLIYGFSEPYKSDRNRNGGVVLVCVHEDNSIKD